VFDWFDVLSYSDVHATHPNRLRLEYGGNGGDSHPNPTANVASTQVFATNPSNFIDQAWGSFPGGPVSLTTPAANSDIARGTTFRIQWTGGAGGSGATLTMWVLGPGGLGAAASGVAAAGGFYDWDSTGAATGWRFFTACVTDSATYLAAGPAALRVVPAVPPAVSVQADAPFADPYVLAPPDALRRASVPSTPAAGVETDRPPAAGETLGASPAGREVLAEPVRSPAPAELHITLDPTPAGLLLAGEERLLADAPFAVIDDR